MAAARRWRRGFAILLGSGWLVATALLYALKTNAGVFTMVYGMVVAAVVIPSLLLAREGRPAGRRALGITLTVAGLLLILIGVGNLAAETSASSPRTAALWTLWGVCQLGFAFDAFRHRASRAVELTGAAHATALASARVDGGVRGRARRWLLVFALLLGVVWIAALAVAYVVDASMGMIVTLVGLPVVTTSMTCLVSMRRGDAGARRALWITLTAGGALAIAGAAAMLWLYQNSGDRSALPAALLFAAWGVCQLGLALAAFRPRAVQAFEQAVKAQRSA